MQLTLRVSNSLNVYLVYKVTKYGVALFKNVLINGDSTGHGLLFFHALL